MLLTVHWHDPLIQERQLYTIPATASSFAHCFSIDGFIQCKAEHAFRAVFNQIRWDPELASIIISFLKDQIKYSYCIGDCTCQLATFLE